MYSAPFFAIVLNEFILNNSRFEPPMKICWILVLCALQHVYYVNTTDDLYVTVMSERSGTEDDDYVAVQCPDGYFLVGCGIHGFYQDGLQVPHSGTQRCVAYNGGYDPNGVTVSSTDDLSLLDTCFPGSNMFKT